MTFENPRVRLLLLARGDEFARRGHARGDRRGHGGRCDASRARRRRRSARAAGGHRRPRGGAARGRADGPAPGRDGRRQARRPRVLQPQARPLLRRPLTRSLDDAGVVGVGDQRVDRHHVESARVRRGEHHRRRAAARRAPPASARRRTHQRSPGESPAKAPFRPRRGQVVPRQDALNSRNAAVMTAQTVWLPTVLAGPRGAASVAVEPGHRLARAGQQRAAHHVDVLLTSHAGHCGVPAPSF